MKNFFSYILCSFLIANILFSNVFALAPLSGDLILHYDAQDMNADGSIVTGEPSNGSSVADWIDPANSFTGAQSISGSQPTYTNNAINGTLPGIVFDGSSDLLETLDETEINLDETFSTKSFALVIETGTDITTLQTIYEQGHHYKGYGFQISGGHLYGGVWNTLTWSAGEEYKIVDFGAISANETYYVTLVHDNANVRGYLDGTLITTLSSVGTQSIHGICRLDTPFGCSLYGTGGTIGIGATQNDTLDLANETAIDSTYQGNHYSGSIGEIISWDIALSAAQVDDVDDYFTARWEDDSTAPVISSLTPVSGTLLPIGNYDVDVSYSDTEAGASGIDATADRSIRYDKNIAPDATITHTPATTWGVPPHPNSIVNGITSTAGAYNYEYHSDTTNAFIEFEYVSPEYIGAMKIYNRIGSNSNRLTGATIKLYDASNTLLYTHTLPSTAGVNIVDIDFKALGEIHNATKIRLDTVGGNLLNIREIEIFPLEHNLSLQKWNGTSWGDEIADDYVDFNTSTKTTSAANNSFSGLAYGKYKASYSISDIAGNISTQETIFYVDAVDFTISTSEIDMGTLSDITETFSSSVAVTVKTVGAGFDVTLKNNTPLTYDSETIINWDGTTGYGYDLAPYATNLINIPGDEIIASEPTFINTDGNINTYTYDIKIGALIDIMQAAGNYEGTVDFGIEYYYDELGTDVTGAGTASALTTYGSNNPAEAFDGNTTTLGWGNNNALPTWLSYDLGAGNAKTVRSYSLQNSGTQIGGWNNDDWVPTQWIFQGSNDATTWDDLDERIGYPVLKDQPKRTFHFENTTAYRYYRISIQDNNNVANDWVFITEMELME